MPTYIFRDNKTGEPWEDMMSNSQREIYLKNNPEINQVPGGFVTVGDHLMGVGPKNDEGFKDLMKGIASKHPDSPMADKYGNSKSIQRLKSESIINEHRKRK